MPNRFSDKAANADVMKDDGQIEMPDEIGADGTPRDRSDRSPASGAKGGEGKPSESNEGEAKPGKDINAPGFVKDS